MVVTIEALNFACLRNLEFLSKRGLGLSRIFGKEILGGRASLRTTTADHVPVIGSLFSDNEYKDAYHDVRHGKSFYNYPKASDLNGPRGLYIFNAFGSRGFTLAIHAAEVLVAQMFGLPIPADRRIIEEIHPARFLIRKLRRQKDMYK